MSKLFLILQRQKKYYIFEIFPSTLNHQFEPSSSVLIEKKIEVNIFRF